MAEEKKELLSQKEQNTMLKTVYSYIGSSDKMKGLELCFEGFKKDGASMALFTDQGACVMKRFITGGYQGFLPFVLVYRSNPKSDAQRLAKVEFLNELGVWLADSNNYPNLENIEIESIEQTSVPFKDDADGAGDNDYVVTFNLFYRKEE